MDWIDMMINVFDAAGFLGAMASEATTRSADCLIAEHVSQSRSAIRIAVNMATPAVVMSVYLLFWTFALRTVADRARHLVRRIFLSFTAVSYLSYITITNTALNVLYCVEVETSTVLDAESVVNVWAVDTKLQCYEGSHAVLLATVGWPVLVFFSVCFPVGIAVFLIRQRFKGELASAWLYESCGFMYRSYSDKFVFWESVIMCRKALLAVAVTFAYTLGGNLQGLLCCCILVLALYVHMLCTPYRSEFSDLNLFEGLSLIVSASTFASGLFFNDVHTSTSVRVLLTVIAFSMNTLLLLFFFVSFCRASAVYLRVMLTSERDFETCEDWSTAWVLILFCRSRMSNLFRSFSLLFRRKPSKKDQAIEQRQQPVDVHD